MMSKPHIAIGTATGMMLMEPSPKGCLIGLIGGAIGSILPDIDIIDDDKTNDTIVGWIIVTVIVVISFFVDGALNLGILQSISVNLKFIFGTIIMIPLFVIGMKQSHRAFTHSFFAMIVYSIPITLISPLLTTSFTGGYFSHLFLDFLNKKGEQLFFPLKSRFCLHLCYADKLFSKIVMVVGIIMMALLIYYHFSYGKI